MRFLLSEARVVVLEDSSGSPPGGSDQRAAQLDGCWLLAPTAEVNHDAASGGWCWWLRFIEAL